MRRHVVRSTAFVLALTMLLAFARATPARAADTPFGSLPIPTLGQPLKAVPLAQTTGSTSDQDIAILASDNVTYDSLVAAGWLHLDPTATGAVGYFIDNLAGAKKYPASRTSSSTIVNTHYGKFVFDTMTGNATTVPAKLGKAANASIGLSVAHAYTNLPNISFDYIGYLNIVRHVYGTINFTYDANNILVPYNKTIGSISGLSVTSTVKTTFVPITAPGIVGTAFIFQMKVGGKLTTFVKTTDTQGVAVGAGNGAGGVLGSWQFS